MNKKSITLIIIIILIAGAIYYLEQGKVHPINIPKNQADQQPMPSSEKADSVDMPPMPEVDKQQKPPFKDGKYPLAPELVGITGYINTPEGTKISDFEGKVVLVDFWTYSCINCIRTLPHLVAWDKKYRDKGLVIIGVHTPEFEFEKDRQNLINAMKKYGIEYIVVQDNNYATWQNYKNRFWPRKYLIDKDGYIRYDHIGEGAYDETEKKIQELLAEIDPSVLNENLTGLADMTPTIQTTPELYVGSDYALPRGQNIGNSGGLQPGKVIDYSLPSTLEKDIIYLGGKWLSNSDNLESKGSGSIVLEFTASSLNIVADAVDKPVEMEVMVDGKYLSGDQAGSDVQFDGEKSYVLVDEPRLYNVVSDDLMKSKLELKVPEGFTFNAFTFG